MLSPDRQAGLLAEAHRVDTELSRKDCGRSDISLLVQAYLSGPGTHDERLEQTRHLVRHLPESWLKERSAGVRGRIPTLTEVLGDLLAADYSEPELRFLLGWILRLAKIRKDRYIEG